MSFSLWDFFTHPLLRGPTLGTLFLCIASSLLGVVLFFQRRPLLSETLSHATFPGILLSVWLQTLFFPGEGISQILLFSIGGGAFALLSLKAIEWMEKHKKVPADAALTFALTSFFGIGTLIASALQYFSPKVYQEGLMLLFGQAAIMQDIHAYLYGFLAIATIFFLIFSFRHLQLFLFDPQFGFSAGLKRPFLEKIFIFLLLISLILGVRGVGVLLISGMSIAPAIAARQFTNRLQTLFYLAAFFGAISGLLGNWISVYGSIALSQNGERFSLPTGPMIIAVSGLIAFLSLLFAPKRGWLFRLIRIASFRLKCLEENLLKGIWKKGPLPFSEMKRSHQTPRILFSFVLWRLQVNGWIERHKGLYLLSSDGLKKAAVIVRLHRLWELYLASQLGLKVEKVHRSAEEMEHILTPDLEERLTSLLADPKIDPHDQKIPERPSL